MAYAEPVNMSSITELFIYANTVTDDIFVILLLISIYIVPFIYLLMKNPTDWRRPSLTAGYIVSVSAILLRISQVLTNDWYMFFAFATIVVPLVFIFLSDSST